MFKILDLHETGAASESLDVSSVRPPASGALRWVDLTETNAESLGLLQEQFGFHPLEIEDCATFELRSKIDEYPDHLFVVLHTFTRASDDPSDIQIHEVHAFVGDTYLVTVHDNPIPAAEAVWAKAQVSGAMEGRKPCWLLYMTADSMVDAVFPMLTTLTGRLDAIEESLFSDDTVEDVTEIFRIKRTLVEMRRIIRGMRDVVGMLARRDSAPMTPRTMLYFRDIYDHTVRCAETIDEALAIADNAMHSYQTAISNRTNEIVRKLTIFSVIFLPLGFITGFWGQNFSALPINSTVFFYSMLGATIGVPIVLLTWFWRRGWL